MRGATAINNQLSLALDGAINTSDPEGYRLSMDTVIVALPENEYEYPLFGAKLSHRLIPYRRALEHPEIAAAAEYLVYDGRIPVKREPTDIGLGYRWALRKLPPGGRGWTLQK